MKKKIDFGSVLRIYAFQFLSFGVTATRYVDIFSFEIHIICYSINK